MYQLLLTFKYLTHKVMPLLAALAVTLCTAMVLIVWSVMGGFLTTFLQSGKTLIGDVLISYPTTGFAHYDDLCRRLEADPMVEAAAPIIESFGMLQLPLSGTPRTGMLWGVDPDSFDRVVKFRDSLWWKPLDKPMPTDTKGIDLRLDPEWKSRLTEVRNWGNALAVPREGSPDEARAALVVGVMMGGYNERLTGGVLDPYIFLPGRKATLSVVPLDGRGTSLSVQSRILPIANQFHTGLFELDANLTLLRLDELQAMLYMDEAERVQRDAAGNIVTRPDPETGQPRPVMIRNPARVTTVLVKAKPGITEPALQARVREIYAEFARANQGQTSPPPDSEDKNLQVQTWKSRHGTMIGAIEKEIGLMLFLFGIISLTAVFLVLAIFWAMVSEKTKDIGVLRAIGASRRGVAGLWLSYGLAIGLVGAILGGIAALLIVGNINPIHEWLGRQFGLVVWDPQIYYFSRIPSDMDPIRATIVLVGGVLSSVAGALVPALKAAYMDPVRSLRFE